MDDRSFDLLVKSLSTRLPRRGLGALGAGLLAALGATRANEQPAQAKKKKTCTPAGGACTAVSSSKKKKPKPCCAGLACSNGVCASSNGGGCPAGQKLCDGTCVPQSQCCPACGSGQTCVDGTCTGDGGSTTFDDERALQALASAGDNLATGLEACQSRCQDPEHPDCSACIEQVLLGNTDVIFPAMQAGMAGSAETTRAPRVTPGIGRCDYALLARSLNDLAWSQALAPMCIKAASGRWALLMCVVNMFQLWSQSSVVNQIIERHGCTVGVCTPGNVCCGSSSAIGCGLKCCDPAKCETCSGGVCLACANGGCCKTLQIEHGLSVQTCERQDPTKCRCGTQQRCSTGGDEIITCTDCSHLGAEYSCVQTSSSLGTCMACPQGTINQRGTCVNPCPPSSEICSNGLCCPAGLCPTDSSYDGCLIS